MNRPRNGTKRGRVLVVEDEYLIALSLSLTLQNLGYEVCAVASSADEAVRCANHEKPDVILMDVRLGGRRDGVDAAIDVHDSRRTPVIFLTGSTEPETLARIHDDHPAGVLAKPVTAQELEHAIRRVLGAQ